jgi:hypothetical protein
MLNVQGYRQHITALHPSIERELIIPVGAWVIVPDVFGVPQFGRIESYGFSSDYAKELAGIKAYSVRGLNASKLGYREYSEAEIIMVLGV